LRKESLYATIKELDFDFKTGKLSPEDYQELKNKYRERALGLLEEMESGGITKEMEEELEAEIMSRRISASKEFQMVIDWTLVAEKRKGVPRPVKMSTAGDVSCPGCGETCSADDNFCPYCGNNLSVSQ
jgi:hypothetical protein